MAILDGAEMNAGEGDFSTVDFAEHAQTPDHAQFVDALVSAEQMYSEKGLKLMLANAAGLRWAEIADLLGYQGGTEPSVG